MPEQLDPVQQPVQIVLTIDGLDEELRKATNWKVLTARQGSRERFSGLGRLRRCSGGGAGGGGRAGGRRCSAFRRGGRRARPRPSASAGEYSAPQRWDPRQTSPVAPEAGRPAGGGLPGPWPRRAGGAWAASGIISPRGGGAAGAAAARGDSAARSTRAEVRAGVLVAVREAVLAAAADRGLRCARPERGNLRAKLEQFGVRGDRQLCALVGLSGAIARQLLTSGALSAENGSRGRRGDHRLCEFHGRDSGTGQKSMQAALGGRGSYNGTDLYRVDRAIGQPVQAVRDADGAACPAVRPRWRASKAGDGY